MKYMKRLELELYMCIVILYYILYYIICIHIDILIMEFYFNFSYFF